MDGEHASLETWTSLVRLSNVNNIRRYYSRLIKVCIEFECSNHLVSGNGEIYRAARSRSVGYPKRPGSIRTINSLQSSWPFSLMTGILRALEHLWEYVSQLHETSDLVFGSLLLRCGIRRIEEVCRLPASFMSCLAVDE